MITNLLIPGGKSLAVDKFYVDESYHISLDKPEKALTLNILCYALQDVRSGISNEYPIVKVGRQYWMGEDLRATSYRNGKSLTKRNDLGKGAGYFKPDKKEVYFYNGEAVIAGEMAPDGWRISTVEDWDELKSYLHDDVSLLKVGEWNDLKGNASQQPVNNLTQMSVIPVGMWFNQMQANEYRFVGYWRWDKKNNKLSDQALFFTGEENGFVSSPSRVTDKTYYKGLCIRCVKE
ncbi:MAG: fibrobacter succinogenes major paralogous domain-containing protein [Bacteroides sp.]|nr:fibrobacter succinogenes major paralogous domain-containing protein [Bacteroides sp.]